MNPTTVGIDMAAESARTAIARMTWYADKAEVTSLEVGSPDHLVLHAMHDTWSKVGIDAPLGWPRAFVDFVVADARDAVHPEPYDLPAGWRRQYALRVTDEVVRLATGLVPLSVSTDKIGAVSLRVAALRARLGSHVDRRRDGRGHLVEVYPAAALRMWKLPHRGYKGPVNQRHLHLLVDELQLAAPWLDLGPHEGLARTNDDAFDAVVCALVARAVQRGLAVPVEDPEAAQVEGWIHLPRCSLAELVR